MLQYMFLLAGKYSRIIYSKIPSLRAVLIDVKNYFNETAQLCFAVWDFLSTRNYSLAIRDD